MSQSKEPATSALGTNGNLSIMTQSGHSGFDDSARATSEGESREDRTPVVV
jgi:hypothetical protein